MKSKKQKPVKKYVAGGVLLAGALKAIPALAQGALSIGQIAIGAGELIGGLAAERKLKAPSTATPSSWKDFYESAQNQSLVQQNIDQINQSAATYLQALQTGGTQAVAAGLQPLARQTQRSTQDVYNQQIMREMQAAGQLAAADERAIKRGTDFYENRLDEARAARSGGTQNLFAGASSLGKTLVDLTATQSDSPRLGKQKMTDVEPIQETDFSEQLSIQPAASMIKPSSNIMSRDELLKLADERARLAFEDGGMMTGGKFSHKTNPIDIVQKGKKVGEMTGGEVILNPAQQKKLSKESVYFRQLLKKFNKQK
jgi:hypothetical protein